jgi:hypothetical protein
MSAQRLGHVTFDRGHIAPELAFLRERRTYPSEDAVGAWTFCDLWSGPAWRGPAVPPDRSDVRAALPSVVASVEAMFDTSRLAVARLFAVRDRGYIRPHRDWIVKAPAFTRLHVPLQTDASCVNSEDGIAYHMAVGEIWYVDGSRVHAGACLSEITRLHLVIDFDPSVAIEALFRDPSDCVSTPPHAIARLPFADEQRTAILKLGSIASDVTFSPIVDFLGMLHFEYDVGAADAYTWIEQIAFASHDRELIARARTLRIKYIGADITRDSSVHPDDYALHWGAPSCSERAPCIERDREAILALSALATEANLGTILGVLAAIRVGDRVDFARSYDWLDEIARRTGTPAIVARARGFRGTYPIPFG